MDDTPPRKILVVDDEEAVRLVCQRVLTPLGFSVDTAGDGEQALARLDEGFYDLVVTDFRMPGSWNGIALGQEIKRRSAKTQIVLMTAFPDVDNAVGTFRLGGFDFITKPFERSELIQSVQACFSRIPVG